MSGNENSSPTITSGDIDRLLLDVNSILDEVNAEIEDVKNDIIAYNQFEENEVLLD
jgi:hypothetical protein